MSIMENRYSSGDTIMFIILVIAVGVLGYFLGVKGVFQGALVSDTISSPTPTVLVTPLVTPSPIITPTPLPPIFVPTPTPTPIPLVSGIFGSVTLDGSPVSSVEIRIYDLNNNFIKTVSTDVNGRFRTELSSGVYVVGPFREPRSGAVVNSGRVVVNRGYFSEVNVTFTRSQ